MTQEKINQLLEKMTEEEKIGQLIQLSGDSFQNGGAFITGPMRENHLSKEAVYSSGSVLGISGAKEVRDIQADYLAHNRLGIPLLFMADVVHGYKTIFPIPLALGATFDPEIVRKASAVAAKESAASGIHVTFAPMVDLVRDPRWGRVLESTGEDPYLNSQLAAASVHGFQGDLPVDDNHVAACVKHFAAYGAPEAGREYNTVDISEWRFKEQYLPAYEAAIKAQSLLVMTSFNTLFGVPASGNQHLMRDILRKELKFNGVLISDWDAIEELIHHGVTGDLDGAAHLALKAGVDIDMMSFAYSRYLAKAATLDAETKALIDAAALRVLKLKDALGLFEDPYRGINETRELRSVLSADNLAVALTAAEESVVLLKNQKQTLPLAKDTSIALIGPVSDTGDILGGWSWKGDTSKTETIAQAMQLYFDNVKTAKGCDYHSLNFEQQRRALALARQQDVIVAAVGLTSTESGEASSLTRIQLPEEQLELLKSLRQLNKPLVVVVITGRPLDLTAVNDLADAILIPWFPGSKGAQAITRILSGQVNPSGKLPMTFPRSVGQIPIYYNHYKTGRPISGTPADKDNRYLSKYLDSENSPLFPFGYGLSYSNFTLSKVAITNTDVKKGQDILVNAEITNTSECDGTAVVQLYTHQLVGSTVRPVKSLQAFKRVSVPAGQTSSVTLKVPYNQLAIITPELKKAVEPGTYEAMIGFDSQHVVTNEFHLYEE